jgi:hypothetical protein
MATCCITGIGAAMVVMGIGACIIGACIIGACIIGIGIGI